VERVGRYKGFFPQAAKLATIIMASTAQIRLGPAASDETVAVYAEIATRGTAARADSPFAAVLPCSISAKANDFASCLTGPW